MCIHRTETSMPFIIQSWILLKAYHSFFYSDGREVFAIPTSRPDWDFMTVFCVVFGCTRLLSNCRPFTGGVLIIRRIIKLFDTNWRGEVGISCESQRFTNHLQLLVVQFLKKSSLIKFQSKVVNYSCLYLYKLHCHWVFFRAHAYCIWSRDFSERRRWGKVWPIISTLISMVTRTPRISGPF